MAERLSELERWRIAELSAQGWTTRLIAKEIGRGHNVVAKHLRLMRRPPVRGPVRSPLRLSLIEREEISRGLARGESLRMIARQLGRASSTVAREVAANGGRRRYRACRVDKTAIATLVERKTRFVMLIALPKGHAADVVADALAHKIIELPEQLRRSLTWDQGKEMASHARFTNETGVPVYFCDPRSPWQRGSNENTNGLLRQYFPKRTEIADYTQAELDTVAAELNGRPRQTLRWKTPSQALDEVLR